VAYKRVVPMDGIVGRRLEAIFTSMPYPLSLNFFAFSFYYFERHLTKNSNTQSTSTCCKLIDQLLEIFKKLQKSLRIRGEAWIKIEPLVFDAFLIPDLCFIL
jgi:hypothetical protein